MSGLKQICINNFLFIYSEIQTMQISLCSTDSLLYIENTKSGIFYRECARGPINIKIYDEYVLANR